MRNVFRHKNIYEVFISDIEKKIIMQSLNLLINFTLLMCEFWSFFQFF